MIKEQVENFIRKYNLTEPFVIAFSGGYDSACLSDVLYKLGYEIILIHLNHNWRGEESDREEDNCRNFAKIRGLQFYSEKLSSDVSHTETAAREARYEFFKRCAKKFKTNVVLTAHNYDDNAETVLYRIIKGTGTKGLSGIQENRDIFYRPLLKIKRDEIEKYCSENGLKPNQDSSNENTKYKRNLIRKKIIPLMKEININVVDAINSLSEISKEDMEKSNTLKYEIRQILVDNNIDYDRKKIEDIEQFINENRNSKSGKKYSLTADLWLFVNDKTIEIISKTKKNDACLQIRSVGDYEFCDYVFSIRQYESDSLNKNFPKDNDFKALVELKNVDFTLRYRHEGDRINPLGMNGYQKLKKYFNEKKIPNHKKDEIVLLCKDNEVFWAAGIGISDKIKVVDRPTHIIELRGK